MAGAYAVAVAAGDRHTCAVLGGGGLACWGNNQYFQLGTGDAFGRTIPTAVSLRGPQRTVPDGWESWFWDSKKPYKCMQFKLLFC